MSTAVVTGATSGLGAAFTRRLAARHVDLVLVARNAERLEGCAADLRARYGIATEVLPADLSTAAGCAIVTARLEGSAAGGADRPAGRSPVDLLVNNAGVGISGGFADADPAALDALTALNVLAVQRLTHAAVRSMLPRGRGAILNVSSVSGFTPGPRSAAYSSSKAWVTAFSQALHQQLAGSGIRVTALCPGFVRTDFHPRAGLDMSRVPGWLWLDADRVAAQGLRDLAAGRAISIPGRQYQAIVAATRYLPHGLLFRVAGRFGARAD